MKKLVIAAAIVCAAVAVNASAVNWTCTGVYAPSTTTATAGYIAYLFDAATVSDKDAVIAAIKNQTFDTTYASLAKANGTSFATGVITKANAVAGLGAGTYTYYTVLFDAGTSDAAKNYVVTADKVVTLGAAGMGAAAFTNITGTDGKSWISVKDPEPTPEPTSALLMLLGVAGLALRRKQK